MRRFRRQAGSHGFSISLQGRAVVVGAGLPANGPHRGPSDAYSLLLLFPSISSISALARALKASG